MRAFIAALMLMLGASASQAQTVEQLQTVQHAVQVGEELYAHDQAAWHATDAMLADIRDPSAEGVHGWITERTPHGIVVLFVHPDGDRLTGVYRALYQGDAIVEHGRINVPLTDDERKLYIVRQTAIQSSFEMCAQNYNTVTLPRAQAADIGVDADVYLMPGMTENGVYPFGGYYRLGINSSTRQIVETQRFTNSCISLSTLSPSGGTSRALRITQLIGDVPTEVHVFVSLEAHLPIFVSTHSGLWEVMGAMVRSVPPNEAPANHPT